MLNDTKIRKACIFIFTNIFLMYLLVYLYRNRVIGYGNYAISISDTYINLIGIIVYAITSIWFLRVLKLFLKRG